VEPAAAAKASTSATSKAAAATTPAVETAAAASSAAAIVAAVWPGHRWGRGHAHRGAEQRRHARFQQFLHPRNLASVPVFSVSTSGRPFGLQRGRRCFADFRIHSGRLAFCLRTNALWRGGNPGRMRCARNWRFSSPRLRWRRWD
jgi:hypothetical protein